jgi:hypothetical protein
MPVLPDEIWMLVFDHLDIPDLLTCSRVNHSFRSIALDPRLHRDRLANTAKWLNIAYPLRPSSKDLYERNILLSRVQLAPSPCQRHIQTTARLARIFVKDSLRRGLCRRPTRKELLDRGVMKKGGIFAEQVGSLERQKVVDVIRGFFSGSQRPSLELAIKRGVASPPPPPESRPVRVLARMFSYWRDSPPSRNVQRNIRDPPTRANVHRMTKWFEELAQKERCSPTTATTVSTVEARCQPAYGGVSVLRRRFIGVS